MTATKLAVGLDHPLVHLLQLAQEQKIKSLILLTASPGIGPGDDQGTGRDRVRHQQTSQV